MSFAWGLRKAWNQKRLLDRFFVWSPATLVWCTCQLAYPAETMKYQNWNFSHISDPVNEIDPDCNLKFRPLSVFIQISPTWNGHGWSIFVDFFRSFATISMNIDCPLPPKTLQISIEIFEAPMKKLNCFSCGLFTFMLIFIWYINENFESECSVYRKWIY